MGNPLDRWAQENSLAEKQTQTTANPLDQWAQGLDFKRVMLQTARGRQMFIQQLRSIDEGVSTLEDIIQNAQDENERANARKTLEILKAQTTPTEGAGEKIRSVLDAAGVGIAQGAAGGVDLALAVPDVVARKLGMPDNVFRNVRGSLQESVAELAEQTPQRPGMGTTVANIAGQFAGGIVPYGGMASATGSAIMKAAPASRVGQAIAAAKAGSMGQKIAANVATGLPINAAQSLTMDDATAAERAKTFALGTALDVGFPLVFQRGKPKPTVVQQLDAVETVTKADKPADLTPERTKQIEELATTSRAKEAERELYNTEKARLQANAKAEWLNTMPGKTWNKLSKEERREILAGYLTSRASSYQSEKLFKWLGVEKPAATQAEPILPSVENPREADFDEVIDQATPEQLAPPETPGTSGPLGHLVNRGDTVQLMQSIKADKLEGLVFDLNTEWTLQVDDQPHIIAEASARQVRNMFDEYTASGLSPDEARTKIKQEIAAMAANPDILRTTDYNPNEIIEPPPEVKAIAPQAEVAPPPAPVPQGPTLHSLPMEHGLEEFLALPEADARAWFKKYKIKYDKTESVLDNLKGAIDAKLEKNPNNKSAQADLQQLSQITRTLRPGAQVAPRPDPASVAGIVDAGKAEVASKPAPAPKAPPTPPEAKKMDPGLGRKLFNKNFDKMSEDELRQLEGWLEDRITSMPLGENKPYVDRMNQLMEWRANEQKKALDAEMGPRPEMVPVVKETGLSWGADAGRNISQSLYAGEVLQTATRELLQNSFDAVSQLGLNGEVKLDIDTIQRSLDIWDNGVGMTPEQVEVNFLRVGEPNKTGEAAGGFGFGKGSFIGTAEHVTIESIAVNNKGELVKTQVYGSADDWFNGKMQMVYDTIVQGTPGTHIRVRFKPETKLSKYWAEGFLEQFKRNTILPAGLDVSIEGKKIIDDPNAFYDFNSQPEILDTPQATVVLWPSYKKTDSNVSDMHITNNGLYQFSQSGYFDKLQDRPSDFLVEIRPKVLPNDPNYPFTLSREQLKGKITHDLWKWSQDYNRRARAREITDVYKSMVEGRKNRIPGHRSNSVYVADNIADPTIAQAIAKSNWAIVVNKAIGDAFERIQDTLGKQNVVYSGLGIARQWYGINIPKEMINKAAKDAGINWQLVDNMVLINPFTFTAAYKGDPDRQARHAWGTIVHEFTHQEVRSHDEAFSSALTRTLGETAHLYAEVGPALTDAFRFMNSDPEFTAHNTEVRRQLSAIQGDSYWKKFYSDHTPEGGLRRDIVGSDATAPDVGAPIGGSQGLARATAAGGGAVPPGTGTGAQRGPVSPGPGDGGKVRKDQSYIWPSLKGGATGMVYGVLSTEDDDPDRMAKIAMWAAIGAGGGLVVNNLWFKNKAQPQEYNSTIPNTQDLNGRILSVDQITGKKESTMTKLRKFYTDAVTSTGELESIFHKLKMTKLPAQVNALEQIKTWGRSVAMTESWLTHQVAYVAPDGTLIKMVDEAGNPIKPLQRILVQSAQGEKANLDMVLMARTSLELAGERKMPMTTDEAQRVLLNAPEYLHKAADEMREYHKALLRVLRASGRLSAKDYDTMAREQWYAPLHRVIGGADVTLQNAAKKIKAPTDIRRRKEAAPQTVLSPYEATAEMTARILRSAEYNNIINTMWQNFRMLPEGLGDVWMRRVENRHNTTIESIRKKAAELVKELKISQESAEGMLAFMEEGATTLDVGLGEKRYMITGWRDGKLTTFQVAPGIYEAFRGMNPNEIGTFLQLISAPARLGSVGVVHNPMFAWTQSIIDTFHAALTSRYGFRPVIDSARGFLAAARYTPQYQELLAAGGPSTIQSLRYTGDLATAVRAVRTSGDNALQTAVKQLKEYQVLEALKSLTLPFAEAARVGEYLRALDHGATVLEATTAAWNVMGNVKLQGASPTMRAFNMMTMFSRPAISAIDETWFRAGLPHPRRGGEVDAKMALEFLLKGMGAITLPSMLLWYANKDDTEINDLRRTEAGTRYWFFRLWDGQIGKIRKPHVIGQIFGTTMEEILDKKYDEDAQGTNDWLSLLIDDATINMIPTFGVVPLAAMTNHVPGLGSKLVPEGDQKLEPRLWGWDRASLPSRIVSEKLAEPVLETFDTVFGKVPVFLERILSPAALDLTVRTVGGMWGEDGLKAVTYAHKWAIDDAPPPRNELPIIGRAFSRYPSANVGPVRMFYTVADRIDRVANTVAEYSSSDPAKLTTYMVDNMDYLALAPTYQRTRGKISQLWRAVNDIRAMPEDAISPSNKRMLEDAYLQQIIALSRSANMVGKAILGQ